MKRFFPLLVGLSSLIGASTALAADPPKMALKDGDRIVLIGDTFIERDQKYGYLETLLTLQNPDKALEFRNLGWSGDTVYGHARAGFGTPVDGFRLLKEHVLALKPSVLIVGYGMGESFDGEAGLSRFDEGLNTLLDTLAPTGAKVILLSPITHEDMGRPLPDPASHNKSLLLYSKAIESIAQKRGARFISLQMDPETRSAKGIRRPLTDNGIHPTDFGYALLAKIIAGQFQSATTSSSWSVDLVVGGALAKGDVSSNPKVSGQVSSRDGVRFETTDAELPEPRTVAALAASENTGASASGRSLKVKGLGTGRFALKVDGRVVAV
ncbi:SGNH/GDSL hydrolase family protein, partial [Singulisphaera rosea]